MKPTFNGLMAVLFCLSVLVSPQTSTAPQAAAQQAGLPRRANIPYFAGEIDWAQSTILWFGIDEQGMPGKNYVDVRLAYTPQALEIRFTVIDYYLWYKNSPQSGDDLSQYDAAVIYLDTGHDRASQPQADDYYLLSAARHWPNENAPQYQRDGRGNGSSWNMTWTGGWSDFSAMQWSADGGGPNNNSGNIDYGWYNYFTIPWAVLGLGGPPANGEVWGLGLGLYDRDANPPAGGVPFQHWPETLQGGNPATWGELHFGPASYTPETTHVTGITQIRAQSPTDNAVEDAWMGGGGTCSGGHEGGSEINHGGDEQLFTGSESAPTHFPCFNKSYLRFPLEGLPPGVEIISAQLTLHHWGNASHLIAPAYSQIHLFTIQDDWQEMTIHWNNAPLAQENVALTAVKTLTAFPGWPGIAYDWDASLAVARAHQVGAALNVALYSSDVGRDTSKYFVSSETGDWNVAARPLLTVAWGFASPQIEKTASQSLAAKGDTLTYQLDWVGDGQSLSMVDQLPSGLGNPNQLAVNVGQAVYEPGTRQIRWQGSPNEGQSVTLTYDASVTTNGPAALINTASLQDAAGNSLGEDQFVVWVNPWNIYLPLIQKR